MPLSTKGLSLRGKFQRQYGKAKGTRVFYATENSNKKFRTAVTRGI